MKKEGTRKLVWKIMVINSEIYMLRVNRSLFQVQRCRDGGRFPARGKPPGGGRGDAPDHFRRSRLRQRLLSSQSSGCALGSLRQGLGGSHALYKIYTSRLVE